MIWAVVPAKLGKNAKERLGPALHPDERARLARAMLLDVLGALDDCPAVDATVVVGRDDSTLDLAREAGARGLVEKTRAGLNGAIAEGIGHCVDVGATGIVIAMGDLPLLTAKDIGGSVARLPPAGVVLVPSFDGTGTNLVVARPPDLLRPEFGPGSFARHIAQTREQSLATVVHECAGAALDVDTPDDLQRLRDTATASSHSAQVLATARREARATLGA